MASLITDPRTSTSPGLSLMVGVHAAGLVDEFLTELAADEHVERFIRDGAMLNPIPLIGLTATRLLLGLGKGRVVSIPRPSG